ncbi:MAG: InlB B-repeat-containing protein, partial [Clostridia bacterium]|nr:InlB B-repeat-containing protein [Clostridia bacterium]
MPSLHNLAILCNLSPVFGADNTAPKNGRISINSGSEYANSNFVTLDIYAEDDSSIQVWISNDGENGTVLDFATNKTVEITDTGYVVGTTLDETNSAISTNDDNVLRITNWPVTEGDGSKRVHVVFRDEFGNITSLTGYITITVTYDLNGVDATLPQSEEALKGLGVYMPTSTAIDNRPFYGWSASPTADIANYAAGALAAFSGDTILYVVFQMPQIGDYVDYGLDYTDVYTNYEFSGDYSWRLLTKTDNDDGTSDIEIISTGIPGKVKYNYSTIGSALWCADATQRTQYNESYYLPSSVSVNAESMKAAAGLLYNFEKIPFSQGTGSPGDSKGFYTAISRNHETGLFRSNKLAHKIIGVRSVMHSDLEPGSENIDFQSGYECSESAEGLLSLKNLKMTSYSSDTSYWLASPDSTHNIYRMTYDGIVSYGAERTTGVRPVVLINDVTVYYDNGVWRIKEALPEYTVTFNANGGTGTMVNEKIVENGEYVLPECT